MSLFLNISCIRCPIRTTPKIKRFLWGNHGLTIREGLRIRYFIPRTEDTYESNPQPKGDNLVSVKEGYKVIYELPNQKFLQAISASAFSFFALGIFFFFNMEYISQSVEDKEAKGVNSISEDEALDDCQAVKKDDVPNLPFVKVLLTGDPKAKVIVALTLLVCFFNFRTRIVLSIHRNKNDFITVFYKPFSFGMELTEHQTRCYYFPSRKILQHNLLGKNVVIFPELFINKAEEELYTERDPQ